MTRTRKPVAAIFDLDNTLAKIGSRDPYKGELCVTDKVDQDVLRLVNMVAHRHAVIFLTGRNENARVATEEWLWDCGIHRTDLLIMRSQNDWRPAAQFKTEMIRLHILPFYEVWFMLDDDDLVVDAVREMGISCWQSRESLRETHHDRTTS